MQIKLMILAIHLLKHTNNTRKNNLVKVKKLKRKLRNLSRLKKKHKKRKQWQKKKRW